MRDEHFHFIAIASWDPVDTPDRHMQWARAFWNAMRAWSADRVYMNILSVDESDRVAEAYGANYTRLAQVKATFDPQNVFRTNHNIPPAGRSHNVALALAACSTSMSGGVIVGSPEHWNITRPRTAR